MAIAEITPRQPDIGYTPDYDKYLARTKKRIENEKLNNTLPPGFPEKLESDLVWDNTDIASRFDWTYALTPEDLLEIESALQHFKGLDKPLGYVNQDTFPLPKLHSKLREISNEIHNGFGFKVVRGLPVSTHSREDIFAIYGGIASHIAPIRGRQDHQYDGKPADVVLNHIKDMTSKVSASKIGAPAYTTDKQVFHTDSGDIIALLCLEEAAEGGQSKVSSSWRVYNELASTRPDLIRTLSEPWPTEVFNNPSNPFTHRPLLHFTPATPTTPQRLVIQYARRTFTGFLGLPRSPHIPPITEAQAEALDALHYLAEKHALGLDFKRGDVQFVNNLSVFHARDGFRNDPVRGKERHLVRLWLRDPELAWGIPAVLGERWEGVFGGREGVPAREREVWPLEPYVRSASLGVEGKKI
ncbi:Clavaminate synthase-like protein [Plenodomus tracheiphilus IPT5]|uniref:Clavaminate synthase-like protein n=1 Tax=Plenodomus tracheiphilus IPT5 TaxID=1408161 RepID=A0A6A7BGZ6_9PLEO|nr:Clavaminate synthase-like protein [Plenodomus tracheiphilus IPT5]